MRTSRALVLFAVLLTAVGLAPAAADASPRAVKGAAGAGDPYFPRQGNGGYDVASYKLAIGYTPTSKRLTGHATIKARATSRLSRFNLDLRRNLVVSSVQVDGKKATFTQPATQVQELVITPRNVLKKGHRFEVRVQYAGTAKAAVDPDGALDGFIPTNDGAFVASEPQGSPTWFPVNDTPRDKATYSIAVTVPKGLAAISNGALTGQRTRGGRTTWSWRLDRKISSYLVTATIGKFTITRGRTPGGIPYLNAVDPSQAAKTAPVIAKLPAIVDWLAKTYGRYPFGQTGAIVDNAPNVGYALETATRPVFDRAPDVLTLAHELAHQWFGDDVTLSRWRDIWVNEGFAEFSSWLYDESTGGDSTAKYLADLRARPATDAVWTPPPANPGGPKNIFSDAVYTRGAGTLAALREKVGDRPFFAIMRGWVKQYPYGNATVGQFTAYAERVARRDLTPFFFQWLYKNGKPIG